MTYLGITERDCDLMQVSYVLRAKNKKAMERKLDAIHENAEGSVWAQVISKADYQEHIQEAQRDAQQFRHDIAAEQAGY